MILVLISHSSQISFPGTPVGDHFPTRRHMNLPPGFGLRQVVSPTQNLLPALRASFAFVDQRMYVQRDAEEASAAQCVMFEANLVLEASQREEALHRELQQVRFAEACSVQAQEELPYWEQQERATLQACLRTAELRRYQEAAQQRNVEIASLQSHHRLRGELQEAETSYQQVVQAEAEAFAQHLRQELDFQTTSTQAQSLSCAERQQRDKDLDNQAERWQEALDNDMVATVRNMDLRQELEEAQEDLANLGGLAQPRTPPFALPRGAPKLFCRNQRFASRYYRENEREGHSCRK